MKETDFEQRRMAAWQEFDQMVTAVEKRQTPPGSHELPRRFRGAAMVHVVVHMFGEAHPGAPEQRGGRGFAHMGGFLRGAAAGR